MEVIKHAKNRFQVVGEIAVIGMRLVNEPYSRVFTTRKKAEADAASWIKTNEKALVELAEHQEFRLKAVREYLAIRAVRAAEAARQLSLF